MEKMTPEGGFEQPAREETIQACVRLIEALQSLGLWSFDLIDGRHCLINAIPEEEEVKGYWVTVTDGENQRGIRAKFIDGFGGYMVWKQAANKEDVEASERDMLALNRIFSEVMTER